MDNPARANCVLLWLLSGVSFAMIVIAPAILMGGALTNADKAGALMLAGAFSVPVPIAYATTWQHRIQPLIPRWTVWQHASPRVVSGHDITVTIKSEDKPNRTRQVHLTAELRHHLMTLCTECTDLSNVSHTNSGIPKREDYRAVIAWLQKNRLGGSKGRNQGAQVSAAGVQVLAGMAQRRQTRRVT